MRVLCLSPYPELIAETFNWNGDVEDASAERDISFEGYDFAVSFGYRHILKTFPIPIINIHISYLPWNRGADPNFWSWFDGTPKGVSIHWMDEGIDTGPILARREVALSGTLATTYAQLRLAAVGLFADTWPEIRSGKLKAERQTSIGSYHRVRDKELWWSKLPNGYDTPVSFVEKLGADQRA